MTFIDDQKTDILERRRWIFPGHQRLDAQQHEITRRIAVVTTNGRYGRAGEVLGDAFRELIGEKLFVHQDPRFQSQRRGDVQRARRLPRSDVKIQDRSARRSDALQHGRYRFELMEFGP